MLKNGETMLRIFGNLILFGKLHIITNTDTDFEYPLTDGFDVFNVKGTNSIFSSGIYRRNESSFFFRYDGLKLYSVVTSGFSQLNQFREYNLSSPFDLSTITFANKYTLSGASGSSSRSLFFTRDGLNCYLCQTQKRILRYSMSSPWDLSTLSLQNNTLFSSLYNNTTSNAGILVNNAGTKALIVDAAAVSANPYQNSILSYNISTPHDLSTAVIVSTASARYTSRTDAVFSNMFINDDENKLLVMYRTAPSGNYQNIMRLYELPNNFSLLSATQIQLSVPLSNSVLDGIEISTSSRISSSLTNGTHYFRFFDVGTNSTGISSSDMRRYVRRKEFLKNSHMSNLNTVDSVVTENEKYALVLKSGVSIAPYNNLVNFHEMVTDGNIETLVTAYSRNLLRTGAVDNYESLFTNPSGNIIYVLLTNGGNYIVRKFESPTSYNFSTGVSSYDFNLNTLVPGNSFGGLYLNPTGTSLYSFNINNRRLYQFSASTPWAINLLSIDKTSFVFSDFTNTELNIKINFSPDGSKLYLISNTSLKRGVHQYSLSIPWDISSIVSARTGYCNLYSCVPASQTLSNISFLDNGKVLYHAYMPPSSNTMMFFTFRLTTPYDISTLKM